MQEEPMDIRSERLPRLVRTLHWLGVALVLVGYLTSEAMEDEAGIAGAWHVLAGIGLLLLAVPRLAVHWYYRDRLASSDRGMANRMARLAQWALLAFLIAQPLLGVLAVWAEGEAFVLPFTSWSIASPFAGDLGEWPEELHEGLGNAFYAVIALHAGAALWHHFARRDLILRRMLW
jgi:cytochrome b561